MTRALVMTSVGLAAIICSIHLFACGSTDGSHAYTGRLFLESRRCLGTTSALDAVEGELPERECAPICLVQRRADADRAIYVSTMCAPYPFDYDTSGSDPACPAALEAHGRDDTCFSDGGSSKPAMDASTDAAGE